MLPTIEKRDLMSASKGRFYQMSAQKNCSAKYQNFHTTPICLIEMFLFQAYML